MPRTRNTRTRLEELLTLDVDLLLAGMLNDLPQGMLNRLWQAVGQGQAPAAFQMEHGSSAGIRLGEGSPRQVPRPELRPLARPLVVAVVDDEPMMLDVVSRILREENFELVSSTSPTELLERLERNAVSPDLLVTDEAMPGLSGHELAAKLRQRHPSMKVLYQTGHSDYLFETRPELEPGAAFIEKPFSARGLREACRLLMFDALNPASAGAKETR